MTEVIAIALNFLKWIWNHKTLAALVGVAIFAAIQTSRLSTKTTQYDAAHSQIAAAEHEEAIWKASYEGAAAALKARREQDDANDARAKRQQEIADQKVRDLLTAKIEAESNLEKFRAELERKANEPGATAASVGRAAIAGLR